MLVEHINKNTYKVKIIIKRVKSNINVESYCAHCDRKQIFQYKAGMKPNSATNEWTYWFICWWLLIWIAIVRYTIELVDSTCSAFGCGMISHLVVRNIRVYYCTCVFDATVQCIFLVLALSTHGHALQVTLVHLVFRKITIIRAKCLSFTANFYHAA